MKVIITKNLVLQMWLNMEEHTLSLVDRCHLMDNAQSTQVFAIAPPKQLIAFEDTFGFQCHNLKNNHTNIGSVLWNSSLWMSHQIITNEYTHKFSWGGIVAKWRTQNKVTEGVYIAIMNNININIRTMISQCKCIALNANDTSRNDISSF